MQSFDVAVNGHICKRCGVLVAIPTIWDESPGSEEALCPNGHELTTGHDVVGELRSDLANSRSYGHNKSKECDRLLRTISALQGALTKARKAKGA